MKWKKHWELSTVPDKPWRQEQMRRVASRRLNQGGRPPVLRPCPKCGVSFGALALRKHKPMCEGGKK